MQRFLITYDLLAGSEEEYEDLINALKRQGAVRVQQSVWFLKDAGDKENCEDLRDFFGGYMKEGDRLLVVRFSTFAGRKSITKISKS
jgi:CRISPR/Cas system-associated endoribonuclease Cas2